MFEYSKTATKRRNGSVSRSNCYRRKELQLNKEIKHEKKT
jgi:hypothetical protein